MYSKFDITYLNQNKVIIYSAGIASLALSYIIWGPSNTKKYRKGNLPPGLRNHGNACFVNALLQSLAACERLSHRYLPGIDGCVAAVLQHLIIGLRQRSAGCLSSDEFVDQLRSSDWLITNEQQDSHELFLILVDTLIEESGEDQTENQFLKALLYDDTTNTCTLKKDIVPDEIRSRLGPLRSALTHQPIRRRRPFYGLMAHQMRCCTCHHASAVKFDSFDSLSLMMPTTYRRLTIEMLIAEFTTTESLQDVNCDACKQKSTFTKTTSIAKFPEYLCLHLQRMVWNGSSPVKVNTHVTFGETLDLAKFSFKRQRSQADCQSVKNPHKLRSIIRPDQSSLIGGKQSKTYSSQVNLLKAMNYNEITGFDTDSAKVTSQSPRIIKMADSFKALQTFQPERNVDNVYTLRSVIVHSGGVNSGHFVTYRKFRRTGGREKWAYCSDESVAEAKVERVLSSNAYMLFYERLRT